MLENANMFFSQYIEHEKDSQIYRAKSLNRQPVRLRVDHMGS